jgi:hypothetical protein
MEERPLLRMPAQRQLMEEQPPLRMPAQRQPVKMCRPPM